MSSRYEMKKVYMMMKLLPKYTFKTATIEEKNEFLLSQQKLGLELLHMNPIPLSIEIIQKRRKNLEKNYELKEIFSTFWMVLSSNLIDGKLGKEEYLKFNRILQLALIGDIIDINEAKLHAEADYLHDIIGYGGEMTGIDEEIFIDIMLALIEVWAEMVNPKYHTAFAWALLASTVDLTTHPLKFHPKNQIKCITTINSQQVISYFLQLIICSI